MAKKGGADQLLRQVDEAALSNVKRELESVELDYESWLKHQQDPAREAGRKQFEQRIGILKDQIARLEEVLVRYQVFFTDVPMLAGQMPNFATLSPSTFDTLEMALKNACVRITEGAVVWKIEATFGIFHMTRADIETACAGNMIPVYSFKHGDRDVNANVISPRKATREAIERLGTSPLPRTAELVSQSALDGNCFVSKES